MILSLIVACGRKGEIGKKNGLLWHIPEDLKNFKKLTLGKTIVMGRKTYDSIGRPLPGRETIVLTRGEEFNVPGVARAKSLDEAIALAKKNNSEECVICGGGQIYEQALPLVQKIYLSRIDEEDVEADTFFPILNPQDWEVKEENVYPAIMNAPAWSFTVLERP